MRKILEIWESFQNRTLSQIKEKRAEKEVGSVLGVKIGETDNPYKPETISVAKSLQSFKKNLRRFPDGLDKYIILQKHFLENCLYYPFLTLRLENINPEGLTFLSFGKEMLEDLRAREYLGDNAGNKTFKQVAKEQKLGWWSTAKIVWTTITLTGVMILLLNTSSLKSLSFYSKESSNVLLIALAVGSICFLGLKGSFADRSKKRKALLADFKRVNSYAYLGQTNERMAIFHNGTDRKKYFSTPFENEHGRNVLCNFLDFVNPESKDFESKKAVIKKGAELATSMQGKLFYLIGNGFDCQYKFQMKDNQYTFSFYIAEIGIELDDMIIFLKDWPTSSQTKIKEDAILGHVEKKFEEEGLDMFLMQPFF